MDLNLILRVLWFFLPAAVANMAPIVVSRMPFLATPIDFNKKFRGKPIVGPNKTYRGFLVGIPAAILFVYIQKLLYVHMLKYSLVDYSIVNVWKLGFLMGFGALFGDLLKSFIKRRLGKKSGKPWPPYDQLDWIAGAVIATMFYVNLETKHVIIALVLFGLLHPLTSLVGYNLKLKTNKF